MSIVISIHLLTLLIKEIVGLDYSPIVTLSRSMEVLVTCLVLSHLVWW